MQCKGELWSYLPRPALPCRVQVVLPDLAFIRLAAFEESGRLLGHRVLPVVGLRPGYRHVSLRNESGQPLGLSTLFVKVRRSRQPEQ